MQYNGIRRRLAVAALFLSLATLACTLNLSGVPGGDVTPPALEVHPTNPQGELPTPIPDDIIAEADAEELLLINIYERVNPAVVNITIGAAAQDGEVQDLGQGSGFVVDEEGHIVTNHHVVAQADEVRVSFSDGRVFSAEVIGSDEYADLAVIQVNVPDGYSLTTVELGDSDTLHVGQRVIAIGNPFGLSGSMTVGIISGVGRTLPSQVITDTGVFSNPLIIQTDAAINPGNSGGPLLNSQGQVIGVNAAIRSTTGLNSGIGFAIPVNTVKRIVPQIVETGKVEYPYLGISAQTQFTMSELSDQFDLGVTDGVLIQTVAPGSGAAEAGLRGGSEDATFHGQNVLLGGDIITAVDGVPIHNFDELLGYLVSNTSVGQTIVVTIVRDGEEMDVEVKLGARPSN